MGKASHRKKAAKKKATNKKAANPAMAIMMPRGEP